MRLTALALALVATASLGGCALRSDVRGVEDQLELMRDVEARKDAERARQLAEIVRLQQQLLESLKTSSEGMRTLRGDIANDLYGIQQQLVQLQELTGQSQRRLSELRGDLERRGQELRQAETAPAPGDTGTAALPPDAGTPSADVMYETSVGQLQIGSANTARMGLRELLRVHPNSDKVPDALYYIGQTFETENADSSLAYYEQVVRNYPQSPRSASAQYHIGLIRERAGDSAAARTAYQRVIDTFPNSDEAALARDRLSALGR